MTDALSRLITLSPDTFFERLGRSLADPGYVVFPALLPDAFAAEVRTEITRYRAEGRFRPANIGKGNLHQAAPEVRGDETCWLEPAALTETQKKLGQIFEAVRECLNTSLFLGLWDWEGHYAVYPPGRFYRAHVDRFQNDSRRTVSIVLFFNPDWTAADGGALKIRDSVEVPPKSGTAVFFMSEGISHEVLETHRDRYSFAGWFRQRM